jgi:hypothetical protein
MRQEQTRHDKCVTKQEFGAVQEKVDDLEGRSRRNNIRIVGIPEGAEFGYEDGVNMERFAESLVMNGLHLKLTEDAVQRAHRVGPKKPSKTRDIMVYFLRFKDKEMVRKEAPRVKPSYQCHNIYFNEDFSPYVIAKRRVLSTEMHRRRATGQRAWLSRDKLMFVADDFVHSVTAMAPYFNMTEPTRLFIARAQVNQQEYRTPSHPRSSRSQLSPSPMSTQSNAGKLDYAESTVSPELPQFIGKAAKA